MPNTTLATGGPLVFLCYAHEDKKAIDTIYLQLQRNGIRPWMDKPPRPFHQKGIPPGADWDSEIRRKIQEADYFLAFLSTRSAQKRGYVQREFRLALDLMNELPPEQIFFIPVLLEEYSPPNLRVQAASIYSRQWYRYYEDGIGGLINLLTGRLTADADDISPPSQRPVLTLVQGSTLTDIETRRHLTDEQLTRAEDIHYSLLPKEVPKVEGYDLAWFGRPSQGGGGNYCDIFQATSGEIVMMVGDTVGMGLGPALLNNLIYNAVQAEPDKQASPAAMLSFLNRDLCERNTANRHSAMLYLVLDPTSHVLTVGNAGYVFPLYVSGSEGQSAQRLGDSSMPLGLFPGAIYSDTTVQVYPGDLLLAVSDGVTEAMNPAVDHFGTERLIEQVGRLHAETAAAILSNILASLELFCDGAGQEDDWSLLILKRKL